MVAAWSTMKVEREAKSCSGPHQDRGAAGSSARGPGLWRIGRQDVEDYVEQAYLRTAERIAADELEDGTESG